MQYEFARDELDTVPVMPAAAPESGVMLAQNRQSFPAAPRTDRDFVIDMLELQIGAARTEIEELRASVSSLENQLVEARVNELADARTSAPKSAVRNFVRRVLVEVIRAT